MMLGAEGEACDGVPFWRVFVACTPWCCKAEREREVVFPCASNL